MQCRIAMASAHAQHGAMDTRDASNPLATTLTDAPDGPICVAFSGGMDSSVLLHLMARNPAIRERGLRALHVDHGLHADAKAWAEHCSRFCSELDIDLTLESVSVHHDTGQGPEAAARVARHAAFAMHVEPDETLALGQHHDDQSETFLMRALRASGPDGLAAMRRWRRFGHGWLWRPLLETPRAALAAHAQTHGLQWIEDPSNTDTRLDRNFLRHRVLPLLRERWPHADVAFARSAMLCGEAVELLAAEDAHALSGVRGNKTTTLDVAALQSLPTARRARVLRRWIDDLGLPPLPAQGLSRIEADLLPASADTRAEFLWGDVVIHRWRECLHAGLHVAQLPADWTVAWDGSTDLSLPNGGTLSLRGCAGFWGPLRVHARQGGERITLPGRTHTHALKQVLQARDVAPWQRAEMPLLSDGETLLAAGDVVYSVEFSAWLDQHGACLGWTPLL